MSTRKALYWVLAFFSILFLMLKLGVGSLQAQTAMEGETDLSGLPFGDETYKLGGQWEFYPGQLITPEDFAVYNFDNDTVYYLDVPALWASSSSPEIQNAKFGTYRLVFNLPDVSLYAININRVQSAYKLWINEKYITEQGKVSDKSEDARPKWSSRTYEFMPLYGNNEIVLQVSNFHHKKSGVEEPITIGKPEAVVADSWHRLGLDILLIGALLIMAFYHIGLYILHRRDVSSLFFALTMFASAAFSGTVTEILYTQIWDNFNWQFLLKINYTSNYLRVVFFALFLTYVFKEAVSRKFVFGLGAFAGVMIVFVAVTPAKIFTHSLIAFLIFTVLAVFFFSFSLIKALRLKLPGALYSLLGMIVLGFTSINDILNEVKFIHTFSMVTAGMFVFAFFQAYILSLRSAFFYGSLEELQARLIALGEIKDRLLSSNSSDLQVPSQIICETLNMAYGVLFLKRNDAWYTEIEFINGHPQHAGFKMGDLHDTTNYPRGLIQDIAENGYDITIQAKKNKVESLSDYFVKYRRETIFCIVIGLPESPVAILYFEDSNRRRHSVRHKEGVLKSLKSEVEVFLKNYDYYQKLSQLNIGQEFEIEKRIVKIMRQNVELKTVRDELENQNTYLEKANIEINLQNLEITESINYARKIQHSILPKDERIRDLFPDSLVFFHPKEELSGDFYWAEEINNRRYFACVDCTGHGVPGALMSIVGNNLINHALKEQNIYEPAEILDNVQKSLKERLKQKSGRFETKDGMDMALIAYQPDTKILSFAGARNSLFHFRRGKLTEIAGDRISIGGITKKQENHRFQNSKIEIQAGDTIYMFSDGFQDQLGGKYQRKFMKNEFRKFLTEIHRLPTDMQLNEFKKTLADWKQDSEQTDDILVIAVKF